MSKAQVSGVEKAFVKFMAQEFESACILSTRAAYRNSGYSVELFDNGFYRILWDEHIGALYDSPGMIIGIPVLTDEEIDEEDVANSFFENAIEEMQVKFQEAWNINAMVQDAVAMREIQQ